MTSTTLEAPEAADEWMSPHEAADFLHVHPQTIYKAIRARQIAHHKLGPGPRARVRLRRADLEAWLDSHRIEAR